MVKNEPKVEDNARENDKSKNKRKFDKKKRRGQGPRNAESFRGAHRDFYGFVYTYDAQTRADQYDTTTKKVAEWAETNLLFNNDIRRTIIKLKKPDTKTWRPTKPADNNTDKYAEDEYKEEFKEYQLRKRTYKNNYAKMFAIVHGQCSETLKTKLEGQDEWEDIEDERDMVSLLKNIKVWMLNQQESKSPPMSALSAIIAMFRMEQGQYEGLVEYRRRFVAAVEVLDHIEVDLGKALVKLVRNTLKDD